MWFLAGYAIGLLPYGPLGAHFGNRKVTLVALVISMFFAALCFLPVPLHSLGLFHIFRFLLGFSMSIGLKMAFSYIGKCYLDSEIAKMSSYLITSFALAPSISVFMTGWLVSWLGYLGALLFQFFYCVFVFFLARKLPPDQPEAMVSIHRSYVFSTFKSCFTNPRIAIPGILISLSTSLIYLFATESPFIAIDYLKLSPGVFGVLYFLTFWGALSGGILSGKTAHLLPRRVFIGIGIVIMSLGSLVTFFLFISNKVSVYSLFIPMFFILVGSSYYYANAVSIAMEQKLNKSYISSTIQFINMGITTLFVFLLSILHPTNLLVMPTLFLIILLISIVFSFILTKYTKEA
ncbi:MAG: Bicyclomycin resistance protein [Chlamydiae bacterium]|nr:Bicyclomycin resistance protein [Chlamydiota bacterium]